MKKNFIGNKYQNFIGFLRVIVTPNSFILHLVIENIKNIYLIIQYKSISLINCSVMIITKALTERLASFMDTNCKHKRKIYILDNIVCAHKILHTIRKNKKKRVVFI
jgi:hypothetical protein